MLTLFAAATLSQVWAFRTDSEICDVQVGQSVAAVGTMQSFALVDLATGRAKWSRPLSSGQFGCRVGISGDQILVSVADGPLRVLDLAGNPKWSLVRSKVSPHFAVSGPRLILNVPDGKTACMDLASRKTLWTAVSGALSCSPSAIGLSTVLGNRDGDALMVGPDGTQIWRTNVGDSPIVGIVADDERVYVATARGIVAGLGRGTGSVVWTHDVANAITGAPLLVDGRVVVTSSGGYAVALTGLQGQQLWSAPLSSRQDFGISPPALAGGFVMAMQRNRMVGLNERGAIAWEGLALESASALAPIKLPVDYLLIGSHALFRVRPQ